MKEINLLSLSWYLAQNTDQNHHSILVGFIKLSESQVGSKSKLVKIQNFSWGILANMLAYMAESEKPRRRVGIADRKVFARLESFCAYLQNLV